MARIFWRFILAALLFYPALALGDADGPDFFRVVDVADDDVLNMRAAASASSEIVGQIPHDGDGVQNLGCEGRMSYGEWAEASEEERAAAARRVWCRVSYAGQEGWSAGRFLAEGSAPQLVSTLAPSFDCAKAVSSAEDAVCVTPWLARLDLELARLFGLAVASADVTGDRLDELKAMQRGWIKGRDDCWKADNLESCVSGSYAMRIDELRTGYAPARSQDADGISLGPLPYVCDGLDVPVSVVVINADPGVLSLRWGQNWVTPRARPSASGGNYVADTAEGAFGFWIKGDNATFSRPDLPDLTCVRDVSG